MVDEQTKKNFDHDTRNPLTGMAYYTKTIAKNINLLNAQLERFNDAQNRYAEQCEIDVSNLKSWINDLYKNNKIDLQEKDIGVMYVNKLISCGLGDDINERKSMAD